MSVQLTRLLLTSVCTIMLCPTAQAASFDGLVAVRNDLNQGQADDALRRLKQALGANQQNAEAENLFCRVSLQLERWDDAASHCERAAAISPNTSGYHLWLGRAYGEKADRASMFSAYGLARKVKAEFESAVNLDPRNAEAMSDLGEFYVSAPSIVGGGTDKAESIARKLSALDPVRTHELRARIAEAQKNYSLAETELKASIASSPHPANQWMALASFYRKRGLLDEMVQAIKSGIATDSGRTVALANGASTLIRSKREPGLAIQMLGDYLASSNKSEDAPAFQIHLQLGNLLAKQGDPGKAQREFQAALALAHDYKPAARQGSTTGR